MSAETPASQPLDPVGRLWSIDALRGFDMFWIMGADQLVRMIAERTHTRAGDAIAEQMEHVEWQGFRFYDLIFPLFLFLVGTVLPFSLGKIGPDHRKAAYLRIARRTALLFLLGVMSTTFFRFDWHNVRVAGVLQRIAICYGIAAVLYLNTRWVGQILIVAAILAGYWGLMTHVAPPGGTAGDLSASGNLAGWVDRHYLPGKLFKEYYGYGDNEGLLSTIPAIATALLGVLAGQVLKSGLLPWKKIAILLVCGAIGVGGGYYWGQTFPIIKNLWTSSFVLVAGGFSAILLALSYLFVDVLGFKKTAFFFVVIGANAITIYWLPRIVDFEVIAGFFLGRPDADENPTGLIRLAGVYGPIVAVAGMLAVKWLLLLYLYRNKLFLRV